jgi:IclR family pca regulon transcriptional regulator
MNIEEVATPYLQRVRDATGDSSSLAVLSGDEVLYLAHVSTERRIRLGASVGTRFPAYPTSLGRVLLAYQTNERIESYLSDVTLQKLTEHTVSTKDELRRRIKRARAQGYDSVQDELDYGIVSVAVPVFNADHRIVAAINCSTSTTRIAQDELVRTRLPLLQEAAREVEAGLQRWPFLVHSLPGG